MKKIKTLIAYDDENVTNDILNSMKDLEYVEVVGTAATGEETCNKIVDLKPDMVFTKFDMGAMNGLDIMKLSKEKLDKNIPVFNLITNNITDEQLKEATTLIGRKLNSLVAEPVKSRIVNIMEDYKNYKNKENL